MGGKIEPSPEEGALAGATLEITWQRREVFFADSVLPDGEISRTMSVKKLVEKREAKVEKVEKAEGRNRKAAREANDGSWKES